MPFKKVKKNAIAIFGGVSAGYKRQKADNVPPISNSTSNNTPNSATRLLGSSKKYDILPTRKSSESETLAEVRRDDVNQFHGDRNTIINKKYDAGAGTDADRRNHSANNDNEHNQFNDNKHNQQRPSGYDCDSGEPVFQNHHFGNGAMEGIARNNTGTQEGLVQRANRTAIATSTRWQNSATQNSNTIGSSYPRHMNLGRTVKVMPSSNNDDQDLILAFDDIASRRGEELLTTQQLPEPEDTMDRPVPASPQNMSPLRARRLLEPPGSSTMPLSRDPPGSSRNSSPAHRRVDPSGDTGTSTTIAGRRMIRVIEVNASSPTRTRNANTGSLTPPMRRASSQTNLHSVSLSRRIEVQGDNTGSPRHHIRQSNDFEEQEAPQLFHPSERIDSLSPPRLSQKPRRWSETHGPGGPQYASRGVDAENHGFSAPFSSSSFTSRNTSVFNAHNQVTAGQRRHVQRQTSDTQAAPFVDTTVYSRNLGHAANSQNAANTHYVSVDEINNPFASTDAPSAATERRLSRHNIRSSQMEPPTTTSQQPISTENRIHHHPERRFSRSSMGAGKSPEFLQTYYHHHYINSPEELPKPNLVSSLVAAFEQGRPMSTRARDEVPDKLVGPRKPRSSSEDFGVTRRRLDDLEDLPVVGPIPGKESPTKIDTELEFREDPPDFLSPEPPSADRGSFNLLEAMTRYKPVDSPFDPNDENMRIDPRRAPLSETNRRILNKDDPSQCTFWVVDAYGRCQYLELDVENANPQTIEELLGTNKVEQDGNRLKIGSRLWKEGNASLGDLLSTVGPKRDVEPQQDSRFKIGSRLWNEATGTGSIHATKGYGKIEVESNDFSRSCLTPTSKKNSKRRNLKASLSFRAQSTKARLRRSFSFGSVR